MKYWVLAITVAKNRRKMSWLFEIDSENGQEGELMIITYTIILSKDYYASLIHCVASH